jgi:hypothetical protein
MARTPTRTAGSELDDDMERLTDDQLGIGVDDRPPAPDEAAARIASAMSDPVIAAAVEQLVNQRVAQMALGQAPALPAGGGDFMAAMTALGKQIADSINRSTAATVEQMPGHIKPIPVEEVEARQAAYIEMEAAMRDAARRYRDLMDQGDTMMADQAQPAYFLKEDFFADDEMFLAGETIHWFGAPGCHMEPRNPAANAISRAMWRYIGNELPPDAEQIGSYVSQMRRPSSPGMPELPPLGGSRRGANAGPAPRAGRVAGVERVDVGPDRIVGTLVREVKGGFGHGPRIVRGDAPYAG